MNLTSNYPENYSGIDKLIELFNNTRTNEEIYQKIIELGSLNKNFPLEKKIEENLVNGCQSTVYLHLRTINNILYFESTSDALISSGLAYLATTAYSGLSAEEVLKTPPTFIEKIKLNTNLTPNRSNGLQSIISLIKQKALQFYMLQQSIK